MNSIEHLRLVAQYRRRQLERAAEIQRLIRQRRAERALAQL